MVSLEILGFSRFRTRKNCVDWHNIRCWDILYSDHKEELYRTIWGAGVSTQDGAMRLAEDHVGF